MALGGKQQQQDATSCCRRGHLAEREPAAVEREPVSRVDAAGVAGVELDAGSAVDDDAGVPDGSVCEGYVAGVIGDEVSLSISRVMIRCRRGERKNATWTNDLVYI